MKTTTRAMLVDAAIRKTDLQKEHVSPVVELMFDLMAKSLTDEETVKLSRFGSFQIRERKERTGRNPRTGIEYTISSRRTIVFIPINRVRDAISRHRS
ncbi:MAG: HU family DNA-binding protein [Devosia sp.]